MKNFVLGVLAICFCLCFATAAASPASQANGAIEKVTFKKGDTVSKILADRGCNPVLAGELIAQTPEYTFKNIPVGTTYEVPVQCPRQDSRVNAYARRVYAEKIREAESYAIHKDDQNQIAAVNTKYDRLEGLYRSTVRERDDALGKLNAASTSAPVAAPQAKINNQASSLKYLLGTLAMALIFALLYAVEFKKNYGEERIKPQLAAARLEIAELKKNPPAAPDSGRVQRLLEEIGQCQVMRKEHEVEFGGKHYTFTGDGSEVSRGDSKTLFQRVKCPCCTENHLLVRVPVNFREPADTTSLREHLKKCRGLKGSAPTSTIASASAIETQFPSEANGEPSHSALSVIRAS